jgi:hypothetical protein
MNGVGTDAISVGVTGEWWALAVLQDQALFKLTGARAFPV